MNKKLVLLAGLFGLIIGIAFFVSAYGYDAANQKVTLRIEKGWNLIPTSAWEIQNQDSVIKMSDFKYGYAYDIIQKKYLLVYKDGDWKRDSGLMISGLEAYYGKSSMWVYSEKQGDYILGWGYSGFNNDLFALSNYNLKQGWNFIFITPEMVEKSLWELKGNCDIKKVYVWDAEEQKWNDDINQFERFRNNNLVGFGVVIKVSNDCKMGTAQSGSEVNPPGLPGNSETQDTYNKNCIDTDNGLDYYKQGAVYYGDYDYIDSCVTSTHTANQGTSNEYTLYKGDVVEYSCYGINNDKRCVVGSCRFISFHCPNGCNNGACIA